MIHRLFQSSLGACLLATFLASTPGAAQTQIPAPAAAAEVAPGPALPQTPAAQTATAPAAQVSVEAATEAAAAPPGVKVAVKTAKPPIFAPFEKGRRWSYVYVRERTRTIAGGTPEIEKLRGTLIHEVMGPAPKLGEHVVRMRSSLNGKLEGEATAKLETSNSFYRSQGTSYQLVAEEVQDPAAGSRNLTRYLDPLRMLESQAAVGHRWTVGVRQQGQLQTRLEGEILGVQDVQTPKGVFERCLVVRLSGPITGIVEAYGSRMEVPEGHYEATEWYAPGVGRVLTKIEMVQKLVLEDGRTFDYVERTQYALRSMQDGSTTAALPASSSPASH